MDQTAVIRQIDYALEAFLSDAAVAPSLREACRYAVMGGGKRLRPLLAWRCAEAVGGEGRRSLPVGVAIELIHAFSLVHDDLPALDNDDLRRGRPTLHRHAGEAMAILTGDLLLTLAIEAVGTVGDGLDPAVRLGVIREVVHGTRAMIVGQVYDTLGGTPEGLTDGRRLELVHANKTGALIRAACRGGAMLGAGPGLSVPELGAVTTFAERLGLIFQIVDDLLDVEGQVAAVGKATGKDAAAGKLTYPGLLGVAGSRDAIERLEEQAESALRPLGDRAAPLMDLARRMSRRDR